MPHPRKREPGKRALAWQTSLGKTWMSLRRRDEAAASPGREVKGFADCGVSGAGVGLSLADPVHFRATHGASALCGLPAVVQGHLLRVPHLPLGATLQAIGLHIQPPCWESGAWRSVAHAYRFSRCC